MKSELQLALASACRELGVDIEPVVEISDGQFGDYASNVALQLAGRLGKNPREIAEALREKIQNHPKIQVATVDGPGFLNITLTSEALWEEVEQPASKPLAGQVIVAEYSDPNPFKVLHAGHLYTSVVGDAIANFLDNAGAEVHRVNFGGDVGLHVGKTMWAILSEWGGEEGSADALQQLGEKNLSDRIGFISSCYVKGNNAYEENDRAKAEIIELNQRIYSLHEHNDHESDFAKIYWTCREWSYQYFNEFYDFIGSRFEKYYPESQTAPLGIQTVREHIGDVYEESDGAVVFSGEKYGLHTRVFLNSKGLPTYEAKDVGLIMAKWNDYKFGRSVVITGNDIVEYMKVVLKSIEQFAPDLAQRTTHLTHGIVKLSGGVKMSSRLGNVLGAMDILGFAAAANKELTGKDDLQVTLGAVKYAFLKQRMGGDIIYDPAESVSLEGNSGPYLQYAHARACSIIQKSQNPKDIPAYPYELNESERELLRKMSEYQEVVAKATVELMPHHVCTYLYELAQEFNRFYEKNRVIGSDREIDRIRLVLLYRSILAKGLKLLGIEAPERM